MLINVNLLSQIYVLSDGKSCFKVSRRELRLKKWQLSKSGNEQTFTVWGWGILIICFPSKFVQEGEIKEQKCFSPSHLRDSRFCFRNLSSRWLHYDGSDSIRVVGRNRGFWGRFEVILAKKKRVEKLSTRTATSLKTKTSNARLLNPEMIFSRKECLKMKCVLETMGPEVSSGMYLIPSSAGFPSFFFI